jgi:hypothetical protein
MAGYHGAPGVPLSNGHAEAEAPLASSSTLPYDHDQQAFYASSVAEGQRITGHIYMRGFKMGEWSDVNVYHGAVDRSRPRTALKSRWSQGRICSGCIAWSSLNRRRSPI